MGGGRVYGALGEAHGQGGYLSSRSVVLRHAEFILPIDTLEFLQGLLVVVVDG